MESAKPQKEHAFLQRLVGDWTLTASNYDGYNPEDPDQEWSETVRSVGELWIIGEGHGKTPGGSEMTTIITLGFDPDKGHFVGTWIGSTMTYLWVYKGWLEDDGKTLTLEAEGADMSGSGEMAIYHDVLVLNDDNHRSFSGSIRQADGSFKTFMTSEFRRNGSEGKTP